MMIGIYKIENKVNGKVYIGQSVNIESRWKGHKSNLRNNKHKMIIYKNLGINMVKKILISQSYANVKKTNWTRKKYITSININLPMINMVII